MGGKNPPTQTELCMQNVIYPSPAPNSTSISTMQLNCRFTTRKKLTLLAKPKPTVPSRPNAACRSIPSLAPAPSAPSVDASGKQLVSEDDVGSRVIVTDKGIGVLRWVGKADFSKRGKKSFYAGVELDVPTEKGGSGTVASKTYFICPQGCAIFTTRKKITLVSDLEHRKAKAAAAAASSTSSSSTGTRRAGVGGGRAAKAKAAPSQAPAVAPKPKTAKQKQEAAKERVANLKKVHKSPTKQRPAPSLSASLKQDPRVWLPDDDNVFVSATVTFDEGGLLGLRLEGSSEERTVAVKGK